MTNPDNIGTIQIVLVFNTLLLSLCYWLFQWIYGEDLMSYTMNSMENKKYAFKQNKEATPSEFAFVKVRIIFNFSQIVNKYRVFSL